MIFRMWYIHDAVFPIDWCIFYPNLYCTKNSKMQVANLTLEKHPIIDSTCKITCISAAALCYRSYFPVLFLIHLLTFQSATSHYDFWLEGQSKEGKVIWTRHWILALRFAYRPIHLAITRNLLDKWMENFCFALKKISLLLYVLPLRQVKLKH